MAALARGGFDSVHAMARVADQPATVATSVRRVRRLLDDSDASVVSRRVLALCSGGADSVAMVALLARLSRGAAPAAIDVLFLDHALRDDVGGEHDAALAVARSIDARVHVRRCPIDLAGDSRGVEAAARAWRYETALVVARELGCDVVATGHTADDQVEQALLSLVGVTGRGGDVDAMPVLRPLAEGVSLVRPLLALARTQVESVCRDLDLVWGEDPTNRDPDAHVRNAVRANVVPALLAVHVGAGASIARAGARRRAEVDATRELAGMLLDAWGGGDRLDLRALAPMATEARQAVIAAWLRRSHPSRDVGARIVGAVDQLATAPARAACARVDLPGGACVRRDGYDLVITRSPPREGPPW